MSATKTKEKVASNPLTFKQLLGRVQKHEAAGSLLKAAFQTGWLTDETFLTRVSETEQQIVKETYSESAEAKKAKVADLGGTLPPTVGPMADEPKFSGTRAKITAGSRTVEVYARMFKTMQKRHPKAMIFLSPEGTETVIIFSEKTTVAVLPPLKDKS